MKNPSMKNPSPTPPPDGLLAFDSEESGGQLPAPATATVVETLAPQIPAVQSAQAAEVSRDGVRAIILWSLLAIVAAAATTSIVKFAPAEASSPKPAATATQPGHVTLDTSPVGAEVTIDGEARGLTPLTLDLAPGHHEAILRRGPDERVASFDVVPGGDVVQRIEFGTPATTTAISIATEPAGARVTVDGESRGPSPVVVAGLPAGRHRVTVKSATASADRTVTTEPGTTTSVMFTLATTPTVAAGWLTVTAPFEVRVVEGGDVIGTSAAARIMIPAGNHQLDLINPALGYQNRRAVSIESGKTTTVSLDARAALNVNATPWAEVTIDGAPAGVTPIANLELPLGTHKVVFDHPSLGERREDVVVTLQGPNRVSMDMTK
jgi:serine/threonine-protein kinase